MQLCSFCFISCNCNFTIDGFSRLISEKPLRFYQTANTFPSYSHSLTLVLALRASVCSRERAPFPFSMLTLIGCMMFELHFFSLVRNVQHPQMQGCSRIVCNRWCFVEFSYIGCTTYFPCITKSSSSMSAFYVWARWERMKYKRFWTESGKWTYTKKNMQQKPEWKLFKTTKSMTRAIFTLAPHIHTNEYISQSHQTNLFHVITLLFIFSICSALDTFICRVEAQTKKHTIYHLIPFVGCISFKFELSINFS